MENISMINNPYFSPILKCINKIKSKYYTDKSDISLLENAYVENSLELIKLLQNYFKHISDYDINILMSLNTETLKPFGIFIMDKYNDFIDCFIEENDESDEKLLNFSKSMKIELDYHLFKEYEDEDIALIIINQIYQYLYTPYLFKRYQYILNYASSRNLIIRKHIINKALLHVFLTMDFNDSENVFLYYKFKTSDKNFDMLKERSTNIGTNLLNSNISNDKLNFLCQSICNETPDIFVFPRLKTIHDMTEIQLLKSMVKLYMNSLDDIYVFNHQRTLKESTNNMSKRINYEVYTEAIGDKYMENKKKNRTSNYKLLHDTYQNRYYELVVKSKHISSEYDTILVLRDINSVLEILNDFVTSNKLPEGQYKAMEEIIKAYKELRTSIVNRTDIPKYSGLSLWRPTKIEGYN